MSARFGLRATGAVKLALLFCFALSVSAVRSPIAAAATFKHGDDVQVHFLNRWYPGTVQSIDRRGRVSVVFEIIPGHPWHWAFDPADVVYAYEAGALARGRLWTDDSGKFHVKAALVSVDDDGVTLRKPDKTELKIALDRLSENDRTFLKNLAKQSAATEAPKLSATDVFDDAPAATVSTQSFEGPNAWPLPPDPLPSDSKLKQGSASFPTELNERLAGLIPVGGSKPWVLAEVKPVFGDKPARLLWASLDRRQIASQQLLPRDETIVDYHAASHRLLTCATVKENGRGWGIGMLTVWEVSAADKKVKQIVRWKADPGEPGIRKSWARFLDADNVLQLLKRQDYAVWNLKTKQLVYRLQQQSLFNAELAFSPGRKYIAVPEDKEVAVIEAATGKMLAKLPLKERATAASFSDDCRKLAVAAGHTLAIYDITAPEPTKPETATVENLAPPLAWIGDRYLASGTVDGYVLYSLRQHICVWNYSFDLSSRPFVDTDTREQEISDQHLVYAARSDIRARQGLTVGAVRLPGPGVDDADAAIDIDSMMAVKPGSEVRLDVQCGSDNDRIQSALQAKIKANGWVLSSSATNVLVAKMDSKQESKTYQMNHGGSQSVSVSRYISSLQLTVDGKEAWQSASNSGGAPGIVFLKNGETAQSEVDRWQKPKPDPGFFERVEIPAKIVDPAKSRGVGKTEIGLKGLVVKNSPGDGHP